MIVVVFLAPSVAPAAFSRPFLRQITSTPAGAFSRPGGVAVDAEDNAWVGDLGESGPPYRLDGFRPADQASEPSSFLTALSIEGLNPPEPEGLTPPGSVAIARATGDFYVTSADHSSQNAFNQVSVEVFDRAGAFVGRFPRFFQTPAHVAIDNSTNVLDPSACGSTPLAPSECFVYVASEEGVGKFNELGEPESFSGLGSSEIVGANGALAVDPEGNIYVGDAEYAASGVLVRRFNGEETPGVCGRRDQGGFGGEVNGVAVDAVSRHVLLAVRGVAEPGQCEDGVVDEFDIATGRFVGQLSETSARAHLVSPQEVTVDSHGDLYVADNTGFRYVHPEHAVDVFGPGRFVASVGVEEASNRTPTSVVLDGAVNPEISLDPENPNPALSECRFQYVTEEAFRAKGFVNLSSGGEAECEPSASQIPGEGRTAVHAKVSALKKGTTYRYRLVATIAGTDGGPAETMALAFTAPDVPRIDSTSAMNLSSSFADLQAQIDPLGADTHYRFEYDTSPYTSGEAHGLSVPVPDADIGSGGPTGSADASIVQQIGGLQPGTTYHFRVVASNETGTTAGAICEGELRPDCTFMTLQAPLPGLPDNRAYELVTPANKGSAEDMFGIEPGEFPNTDRGVASGSGNGFLLYTRAAFGSFAASGNNVYVFQREQAGWRTIPLASPSLGVQNLPGASASSGSSVLFDPFDFSQVGVEDVVGSAGSEAGVRIMDLVGPPGGSYKTVFAGTPVTEREIKERTLPVGASHDLSRVVLESTNHNLAPGAEGQAQGTDVLYEWAGGGECAPATSNCTLINVNSKGSLLGACGAILGLNDEGGGTHDAISANGSRVFFTSPDPYAPYCWNGETPQLYMRSGATTIEVSRPEKGWSDPTGSHRTFYVGAAEDGSRVFFLTEAELTKDDEGIHDRELYEYDTETKALTRISHGESGKAAADVYTVPAVAGSGAAVYFTAFGRLASAAPQQLAPNGAYLYRYDTASHTTAYVATVSKGDYPGVRTSGFDFALDPEADWYTTPDGRYLLFATRSRLISYDNMEAHFRDCATMAESQVVSCEEVYRYDSADASLLCVSCNPSGGRPIGNAFFSKGVGPETSAGSSVRAMSDDGSYVFFDSADALVPGDSNRKFDVYEWHNGRISLISSGTDPASSFLLGSSPDGHDVFFGTHARLVPQDTDSAGDLYDARICTEEDPCIKPPTGETAQCEGDACQTPPLPPTDATPNSLTFTGSGNFTSEVKTQAKPKKKVKSKKTKRRRRRHHARHASFHRRAGR